MSHVKICGLKRIEDATYVNEVMPLYAGLVFWDRSKRNVSFDQAREIRNKLDSRIKTVGVFVDMEIDKIVHLVNEGIISCVQLHGKESEDTIVKLRELLPEGTLIIKAFEVQSAEDVIKANKSPADMVLIDSGKGSGNVFDWNILSKVTRDYFLAGGLTTDNVSQAVETLRPYAVDVSSGVETNGIKDRDKIIQFCAAVKAADGRKQ